jgi:DNA-binding response OmpR family regulator
MNGWVFRLEQQKDPALAHIPVIILSGHQDPAPAASFLMAESLCKPLDIPLLLARIEHYLGETKDPTAAHLQ